MLMAHKIAAIGFAGVLAILVMGGIYLVGAASQEKSLSAAKTAQATTG